MIKELKYLLRITTTPSCWLREKTDKEWDKMLLKMLESPRFDALLTQTVWLNDKCIWLHNCSLFKLHNNPGKGGIPSRTTVFKFFDALEEYRRSFKCSDDTCKKFKEKQFLINGELEMTKDPDSV